jgi:predicted dehydrogenase
MLRFGLLGCGIIGRYHAEAISGTENAVLQAVADVEGSRAGEFSARYGGTAYASLEQMLGDPAVDVVSICTASALHAGQAVATMKSGRHVVVEKPMAIALSQCDEMIRTSRETRKYLAVIFQNRFRPIYREMKSLIDSGRLGTLVSANAELKWYRSQEYYDSGGWRGSWAMDGGGALMNQTIHYVDLLLWLMGPVRAVQAYTGTLTHDIETEDVAVAALEFASGALGILQGTTSAYPGLWTRLEVNGEAGALAVQNDRFTVRYLADEQDVEAGPYGLPEVPMLAPEKADFSTGWHQEQICEVIRCIEQDRQPPIDGLEGRRSVELILAAYDSARTHREVQIRGYQG